MASFEYPKTFRDLVAALRRLPSVGPRGAERLALHLLGEKQEVSEELARCILEARRRIRRCPDCGYYAEDEDVCAVCADPARDRSLWCVVEQPSDVVKVERAGTFRGLYHVLGGRLSPLEGVEPADLSIQQLVERVRRGRPDEVILAVGADVEGETTALYLAPLLKAEGVRVTRLALGLPAGGGLDYADSVTLTYAMTGRREV